MSIVWVLIGSMQIEEDGKMAMNVTPFVGTDNFNMETFNNMISQINNGVNSEISEVLAQLGTKAKIQTGSYVGTGTYGADNPCSLTFDFVPMFLFIYCNSIPSGSSSTRGYCQFILINGMMFELGKQGSNGFYTSGGTPSLISISNYDFVEKQIRWYSTSALDQFNYRNFKYCYACIG